MTSHETVEVVDSPNSNRHFFLWHNIHSSAKDRTLYIKKNVSLSELSGSLGDLGTLLPILVTLSIAGQISLTSSLIFGGLWNIVSGLMFRIPMCVQPMKGNNLLFIIFTVFNKKKNIDIIIIIFI